MPFTIHRSPLWNICNCKLATSCFCVRSKSIGYQASGTEASYNIVHLYHKITFVYESLDSIQIHYYYYICLFAWSLLFLFNFQKQMYNLLSFGISAAACSSNVRSAEGLVICIRFNNIDRVKKTMITCHYLKSKYGLQSDVIMANCKINWQKPIKEQKKEPHRSIWRRKTRIITLITIKSKQQAIHSIEWIIINQFGDRFIYISSKLIEYTSKEHWAIFIPSNIAQPIMDYLNPNSHDVR